MNLYWRPWADAAVAFLQGTSKGEFGRRLQDIQLHKTRLFGDFSDAGLSEIFSWTERPHDLDLAVSTASLLSLTSCPSCLEKLLTLRG